MKKFIDRITNWEAWPFALLYAPIVPVWLYYIIRSGAVWFFTPSNPKITFGGFEGEGKKEMYELLPSDWYPKTIFIDPLSQSFEEVQALVSQHGFSFPFIVKPDVGFQGILFKKIEDSAQLAHYHSHMKWEYCMQQFVAFPMEVSIFYIRHPQEKKGRITGFLHKVPMSVIGDGISTVKELIVSHPKASKRLEEQFSIHRQRLEKIIPVGEKYQLSYAGNHNRGASFIDLKKEIDDRLLAMFDEQSHRINDFFYGRYDIMCNSVEELKQGKKFSVLEYNGCGAEPNHFYDTGYTLIGAYKEILMHWKWLYQISAYNAKLGIKPWPFKKGSEFLKVAKQRWKEMLETEQKMHQ